MATTYEQLMDEADRFFTAWARRPKQWATITGLTDDGEGVLAECHDSDAAAESLTPEEAADAN